MNWNFKEILEYNLINLGDYSLSVYEVLAFIVIVLVGLTVSRLIKSFVYKSKNLDLSKKFAFTQIIHYIIVIITFFMGMKMLGVNVSPLLVGSGAILVGIGLGLQNLFLDFISGVIILLDRSVKVGDIIDIDGTIGKVEDIKIRTTTILTRDNKHMIFPNSSLTKDRLINFSHNDDIVRFEIEVGVHYNTDINKAERLMKEAVLEHEFVIKDKEYEPIVRLERFGESSLDLKLLYHSRNLFRQPKTSSDIRRTILEKFRKNDINIPYPIRSLEFLK